MADKFMRDGVAGGSGSGGASSGENSYGQNFDELLGKPCAAQPGPPSGGASASRVAAAIIGWVRSPLSGLEDCPPGSENAPEAVLEILPEYAPCMLGLRSGQKIVLLTWLQTDGGAMPERGRNGNEKSRGVFSPRSPMPPNSIGLHETAITEIDACAATVKIKVGSLEAPDGTPILGIKDNTPHESGLSNFIAGRKNLAEICALAHQRRLLAGFNGNASLRLGSSCLITRGGALKSVLSADDFAVLDIQSGRLMEGSRPSSEAGVHLHIYRSQRKAKAVLHTHPPKLMALGLRLPDIPMEDRLAMEVYEADLARSKLGTTSRFTPGSEETAIAAGLSAIHNQAVWLEGHGLCVWAETLAEALGLSEELEHLAGIRLAAGCIKGGQG